MANAEQLILKSTQILIKELENVTRKAVAKATGAMINANEAQLDEGKSNTGQSITPEYSPSYASFKGFSTPDLKATGAWRGSIFIDVLPDELRWGATNWKDPKLIGKYGPDIKGLEENRAGKVFSARIYPVINSFIDKTVSRYV